MCRLATRLGRGTFTVTFLASHDLYLLPVPIAISEGRYYRGNATARELDVPALAIRQVPDPHGAGNRKEPDLRQTIL